MYVVCVLNIFMYVFHVRVCMHMSYTLLEAWVRRRSGNLKEPFLSLLTKPTMVSAGASVPGIPPEPSPTRSFPYIDAQVNCRVFGCTIISLPRVARGGLVC